MSGEVVVTAGFLLGVWLVPPSPRVWGSERRTLTPSSAASRSDVAAEVGCLLRQRPGGVRAP